METLEVRRYKFLIGPPLNPDAADMLCIRLHEKKKNECKMNEIRRQNAVRRSVNKPTSKSLLLTL
jgi:hypothetical protein